MTSKQLRLAFAGTPDLAARILSSLLAETNLSIIKVFTQPDRPAGRGRKPRISPVKQVAVESGLPVQQPASSSELEQTFDLDSLDVMVVVAYGLIIPPAVLRTPRYGCLNIHTSLLPRWRGAAPVQRAIQYGDKETGVSIMQMDEGLDTGPVLMQSKCPINPTETAGSLYEKLAILGSRAIIRTLDELISGTISRETQDGSLVTYAHKIAKQEAQLDWNLSAEELERMVRAFNPAPVAFTSLNGQDMRIWESACNRNDHENIAPGTITGCTKEGIEVACKHGTLLIKKLQIPGKKPMTAVEFLNGRPDFFRT